MKRRVTAPMLMLTGTLFFSYRRSQLDTVRPVVDALRRVGVEVRKHPVEDEQEEAPREEPRDGGDAGVRAGVDRLGGQLQEHGLSRLVP